MVVSFVGCEKTTSSSATPDLHETDGAIQLPVALTPVTEDQMDFDSDGVPENDDKMDVVEDRGIHYMPLSMQITPTESNAASPIVKDQIRVIRRQKKVVDDVGDEIQQIQGKMNQKRKADLDALARRRRWGDAKPSKDHTLYEEWKFGRPEVNVRQFNPSAEAAVPMVSP